MVLYVYRLLLLVIAVVVSKDVEVSTGDTRYHFAAYSSKEYEKLPPMLFLANLPQWNKLHATISEFEDRTTNNTSAIVVNKRTEPMIKYENGNPTCRTAPFVLRVVVEDVIQSDNVKEIYVNYGQTENLLPISFNTDYIHFPHSTMGLKEMKTKLVGSHVNIVCSAVGSTVSIVPEIHPFSGVNINHNLDDTDSVKYLFVNEAYTHLLSPNQFSDDKLICPVIEKKKVKRPKVMSLNTWKMEKCTSNPNDLIFIMLHCTIMSSPDSLYNATKNGTKVTVACYIPQGIVNNEHTIGSILTGSTVTYIPPGKGYLDTPYRSGVILYEYLAMPRRWNKFYTGAAVTGSISASALATAAIDITSAFICYGGLQLHNDANNEYLFSPEKFGKADKLFVLHLLKIVSTTLAVLPLPFVSFGLLGGGKVKSRREKKHYMIRLKNSIDLFNEQKLGLNMNPALPGQSVSQNGSSANNNKEKLSSNSKSSSHANNVTDHKITFDHHQLIFLAN